MKRYGTKIILIALIISSLVFASSCELEDGEKYDTLPVETTTSVPESTAEVTEDAVVASADPMTAASRGLAFSSNGDGTCTLTGIGSCTDTCLIIPDKNDSGEKVTKIASAAFASNTAITAVQIPAGVTEIGTGAFCGCSKLAYISVSNGNTAYMDAGGILYSADGSALICVPAGSSYVSLTITAQVTVIAENATEGCTNLKKVLYEGSEDDWKAVSLGSGNTALGSADWTFMTQTGK